MSEELTRIDHAKVTESLSPELEASSKCLAMLSGMTIEGPKELDWCTGLAQKVKARHAVLEAQRTGITKPILEAKYKVDELFKPVLTGLVKIEKECKRLIGEYARAEEHKRRAAMLVDQQVYQAGGAPLVGSIPEPPKAQGMSVKHRWVADVTDAAQVPREYCSPDPALLAHVAPENPHVQPPPIPGIAWRLDSSVTVRQK